MVTKRCRVSFRGNEHVLKLSMVMVTNSVNVLNTVTYTLSVDGLYVMGIVSQ